MRVAIILTRPVFLGPSIVLGDMINSLSGTESLTFDLYCIREPEANETEFNHNWIKFRYKSFRFEDYDIIHTSGIQPDLIAFLYRKRIRYHLSTIHSLVSEEFILTRSRLFSFIFSNFWMLLWKRADRLVCVSNTVKRYYSGRFSQAKLEVIYNGIPEEPVFQGCDEDVITVVDKFRGKGLKVLGTAAILSKLKNTQLLLDLLAARSEFACVIIGSGKELTNLKRLAAELGISERVFFAGFRKEASNYFRYFDFFVTASLSEGFGLTVVEAAREKVPVLCSGISAFRELFTPDEVTFFEKNDVNSLFAALDMATRDGKEKAEAAFSVFKAKYTSRIMGEEYYDLYKKLCDNKSSQYQKIT